MEREPSSRISAGLAQRVIYAFAGCLHFFLAALAVTLGTASGDTSSAVMGAVVFGATAVLLLNAASSRVALPQ